MSLELLDCYNSDSDEPAEVVAETERRAEPPAIALPSFIPMDLQASGALAGQGLKRKTAAESASSSKRVPGSSSSAAVKRLVPPQLVRPNVVTEDAGLSTRKSK